MQDHNVSLQDLVELAIDAIAPERRMQIEQILNTSPALQRDLQKIRALLETLQTDDTVEPPADLVERTLAALAHQGRSEAPVSSEQPTWRERGACLLATLVFDSREQPALAGFRGSSERRHLTYRSDLASVDVQIAPEHGTAKSSAFRVRGQVTPLQGTDSHGVQLLHQDTEQVVAETQTDERGQFRFNAASGAYDLKVALSDDTILLPHLQIGLK